ncbi:MAG TPA: bifunctional diaminohydroxyphosphoribosylaminopyrimidine deaminase/5-amino-6-(5-phosphoribosylamino)uracil reductase RibD [Candidatus Krumholzibacteria bacterium]|nr:bifunctional diaminohydroxyphosphoribosylaminopyrimidine deaminase/5-amino-6-(5-phosphoribosylamino)uracil reductase RibD [Candidatus Krumholzibacteria bacterium]
MLHDYPNSILTPRGRPAGASVDSWTESDHALMRTAAGLAWSGAGRTGTNPIVGSVVSRDGRIIATGFHGEKGIAHAEVVALDAAGEAARGATLYASLEPCAHHGRTPPCTDRIIAAGVARVVIPALDPDERVNGRGVALLRAAGIQVDIGCEAGSAILDNLGYYHDRLGLPSLVTIKMALSGDGMVARAPGRRDTVTGEAARTQVHALRALHDAVLVGIETLLADAPRLDCRLLNPAPDRIPVPVVLDSHLRTPAENAWSRAGRPFIVVTVPGPAADRVRAIEARGGRVFTCTPSTHGPDVGAAVAALAAAGLRRILVEGGPRVVASLVATGCWDAAWYYRAPVVFGPGGVPATPAAAPGDVVDRVRVGDDERVRSIGARPLAEIAARVRMAAGNGGPECLPD